MPAIDRDSFDGTKIQTELETACSFTPSRTQIALVAQASDGFMVASGHDEESAPFDDAAISAIMVTFAQTVKDNPGADVATLRMAVLSALAADWTACGDVCRCPFDQKISLPTRMIFHVHIPGWGFEPARIKFKSPLPDGEFCGLAWLHLNGASNQPYSFVINARASTRASYEYALFIRASQDAGNQHTRVIIDPLMEVTPP